MMSPQVFEDVRACAPMHVQLQRCHPDATPRDTRWLTIEVRVVRIFRDTLACLTLGQRLSLGVPVTNPLRTTAPELGATFDLPWDVIAPAMWYEAFLELNGRDIELADGQIMAIAQATALPLCGPDVKGFLCAASRGTPGTTRDPAPPCTAPGLRTLQPK